MAPAQNMEFLGFLVNSVSLHLAFPAEKLRKIQQDANSFLKKEGYQSGTWRGLWERPQLQYEPYGRLPYITEPYRA